MKCHILFPGKNKKNISKCCLLKILPRVLSVKDRRNALIQNIPCVNTISSGSSHTTDAVYSLSLDHNSKLLSKPT